MYQIDNSTASPVLPASTTAGIAGYFSDGNAGAGLAPTVVPAEFLNMLMMEFINVVTAAGFTLNKAANNQVVQAIRRLAQKTIVLTDTGTANAYLAANTPGLVAGDLVNGVAQRINILNANTGASTYAPDGLAPKPVLGMGLQPLQGGELVKGIASLFYLVSPAVNAGNGAWVLIECTGGAVQVAAATQPSHAVNLGQFGSLITGNGYQKLPNGLILQWGTATSDTSGNSVVTFPIAFPTALLSDLAGVPAANIVVTGTGFTKTTRSYQLLLASTGAAVGSGNNFRWFAIGY